MSIGHPLVYPLRCTRSSSRAKRALLSVKGHQAVSCWLQKCSVPGLDMLDKKCAALQMNEVIWQCRITPQELLGSLQAGSCKPLIIDVRPQREFELAHLAGIEPCHWQAHDKLMLLSNVSTEALCCISISSTFTLSRRLLPKQCKSSAVANLSSLMHLSCL